MLLAGALRAVEQLVPAVALDRDTPLGAFCGCRPVVRAAAEAAERCTRVEAVDDEGWRAVRMALTGLLPACRAAGELGEREQKKLEAAVARAVVRTQEVVMVMLREYKEFTRGESAGGRPSGRSWTHGGARSSAVGR